MWIQLTMVLWVSLLPVSLISMRHGEEDMHDASRNLSGGEIWDEVSDTDIAITGSDEDVVEDNTDVSSVANLMDVLDFLAKEDSA